MNEFEGSPIFLLNSQNNNHLSTHTSEEISSHVKTRVCHTIELDEVHPLEKEFINEMDKEIIGQYEAKKIVAQLIKNSVLGIKPKKGPLGVLFFYGPTGVGKTEIVKSISKVLMGYDNGFVKINGESYQESHTARQLFGAPPSYLGYGDPTPLDPKVLEGFYEGAKVSGTIHDSIKNLFGFNIILFDEFEKVHPKVAQSLLGILDEGKVTFGNGKVGCFNNSIIIFTSNIGQSEIEEKNEKFPIGFIPTNSEHENNDNQKIVFESIKKRFSPEFRGRITKFVGFNHLGKEDVLKIIEKQVKKLNDYYKKYYNNMNLSITLGQNVIDKILEFGFDKKSGARKIIVTFEDLVENNLINLFNSDKFKKFYYFKNPLEIFLDYDGHKVIYKIFVDNINEDTTINNGIVESSSSLINNLSLPKGINLDKLNSLNDLIKEYISMYNLHLDDDSVDFSTDLLKMEETFIDLGFTESDIKYLRNCSILEILSEVTILSRFDFLDDNKNNFYPLTQRVVYKYVENKVIRHVREKGINIKPTDILDEIGLYLSKNFLNGNNLTTKQILELVYFIGKVYSEKFGLEIYLDDYRK